MKKNNIEERVYVLGNGQVVDKETWQKEQELGAFADEAREKAIKAEFRETAKEAAFIWLMRHEDPKVAQTAARLRLITQEELAEKNERIRYLEKCVSKQIKEIRELGSTIGDLRCELKFRG